MANKRAVGSPVVVAFMIDNYDGMKIDFNNNRVSLFEGNDMSDVVKSYSVAEFEKIIRNYQMLRDLYRGEPITETPAQGPQTK